MRQLTGLRRATAGTVALLATALGLPASSLAWRQPRAGERRAISIAASHSPHAGTSKVDVSHIRVSTVGPWASAVVSIHFGKISDDAVAIVHRVNGNWRYASVGTAGEWCVMPVADRRNLGFSGSYRCS